jgi:hypothetical protein
MCAGSIAELLQAGHAAVAGVAEKLQSTAKVKRSRIVPQKFLKLPRHFTVPSISGYVAISYSRPSRPAWGCRSAIALDCKFALMPGEGFTLGSVRGLMRKNGLDSAFAIETVNLFFPGSVAIVGPLKRQGIHPPVFGVEEGRGLQCGSQDFALLSGLPWPTGRTAQRKIQKAGARRFDVFARLPKDTHAHGGQPAGFQSSRDQSDGLMAGRSKREQQHQVDTLGIINPFDRRNRLLQQFRKPLN